MTITKISHLLACTHVTQIGTLLITVHEAVVQIRTTMNQSWWKCQLINRTLVKRRRAQEGVVLVASTRVAIQALFLGTTAARRCRQTGTTFHAIMNTSDEALRRRVLILDQSLWEDSHRRKLLLSQHKLLNRKRNDRRHDHHQKREVATMADQLYATLDTVLSRLKSGLATIGPRGPRSVKSTRNGVNRMTVRGKDIAHEEVDTSKEREGDDIPSSRLGDE